MTKQLTLELIHQKCKTENLSLIKNLNLWGNSLCDVSLVNNMPNLEVLSLSVNKVDSLKYFRNLKKLQELYLRKNNVSDLKDVLFLSNLKHLRVLWLSENPVTSAVAYRQFVLKHLPNLTKLDDKNVTAEERESLAYFDPVEAVQEEELPSDEADEFDESPSNRNKFSKKREEEDELSREDNPPFKSDKQLKSLKDGLPKQATLGPAKKEEGRSMRQTPRGSNQDEEFPREERHMQPTKSLHEPLKSARNFPVDEFELARKADSPRKLNKEVTAMNRSRKDNEEGGLGKKSQVKPGVRQIKNENVMTAMMVLLNELNEFEVEMLRGECDKKLVVLKGANF